MKIRLLISEAWRSLGANVSTTFAAMMTVLIGMLLLGLLIALGTWTLSWSNHVKGELLVRVDMATTINRGGRRSRARGRRAAHSRSTRSSRSGRVRSKKQALARDEEERPGTRQDALPFNPLPD